MEKISLQGLLWDQKSSFMRGAAKAPPLIREAYNSASANYFAEDGREIGPALFNDTGDYTPSDYMEIRSVTLKNLAAKQPLISLGGDHSVTYPILKAFYEVYGPLDILHIDAHGDLYEEFEGDRYSHGCPFARIMEEGLAGQLTQMGIRTLNDHQQQQAEKYGVRLVPMKDWTPGQLPDFDKPLYLSLDMDALDPAFAPGVSHHEPGGFSTRELLGIIQQVRVPVLGADIVEYNPERDVHGITAMAAAKLFKEIACRML